MKRCSAVAWSLAVALIVCGCSTAGSVKNKRISAVPEIQDQKALRAVANSVTGTELTDSQFQKLGRDIQQDPETRSAVQMVTEVVGGKKLVEKYSPVTGKRYAPNMEYDPETGVKLLPVE